MPRITATRVAALLLFCVACVWVSSIHLSIPVVAEDDAFISFRYSENLATGHGLVYNQGERVFGSSTPLYVFWLAALKIGFPAIDIPTLAVRTNLLWFLGTAFSMVWVLHGMKLRASLALVVATWFLIHPAMVTLSWKGMEAFLLTFLILTGIAASQRGRFVLMAVFFGLAAVTRPEGVLAVVAGAFVWRYENPARPMVFWGALLFPGLLWSTFATAYFGTPIPLSLIAKSAPLYPIEPGAAITTIATWWARWIAADRFGPVSTWLLWSAVAVSVLGGLGLLLYRRSSRIGALQVGGLFIAITTLYAILNPLLFHWYGANIFLFWLAAVVVGLPIIARRSLSLVHRRLSVPEGVLQAVIVGALSLSMVWSYGSSRFRGYPPILAVTGFDTRVLDYERTGHWLRMNASPSSVVCAPEIGALGFFWRGAVLDACALVSPEALPFLPCPPNQRYDAETAAIPIGLTKSERPDYVVSLAHFIRQGLLTSRWFHSNYQLVHRVDLVKPIWLSDSVLVYRRIPNVEKPENE